MADGHDHKQGDERDDQPDHAGDEKIASTGAEQRGAARQQEQKTGRDEQGAVAQTDLPPDSVELLPGSHENEIVLRVPLALLGNPRELAIANQLAQFREVIETAARELAPHMIAFYLKDLAGEFHGWYNAERMLVDDVALRDARVALAAAVRQTIRNGMAILGVSCPESM